LPQAWTDPLVQPKQWEMDNMLRGSEKLVSNFKLNILSVDTFYFAISNNYVMSFSFTFLHM